MKTLTIEIEQFTKERDEARGYVRQLVTERNEARVERDALRKQTRIRDARVEKPDVHADVHTWSWCSKKWNPNRISPLGDEWSSGDQFCDVPYWLPMLHAPGEKP